MDHVGRGKKERNSLNILQESRAILDGADFSTRASREPDIFYFENDRLLGFLWEAPSVSSLLREWETHQDNFLELNAARLKGSGLKSWNIYSVLLTADVIDEATRTKLIEIEEDFRATRKIARGAIISPDELKDTLLPLLPLQNLALDGSGHDNEQAARQRLTHVPERALQALLNPGKPSERLEVLKKAYADKKD